MQILPAVKPTTPGRGKWGPVTSSTRLPRAAVCPSPALHSAVRRVGDSGIPAPRPSLSLCARRTSPAGHGRAPLGATRDARPGRDPPPPSSLPAAAAGRRRSCSLPFFIVLGRLRVCRSLLVVAVNHSVCPRSIGKTKPPYAGNRRVGDYSWVYEATAVD